MSVGHLRELVELRLSLKLGAKLVSTSSTSSYPQVHDNQAIILIGEMFILFWGQKYETKNIGNTTKSILRHNNNVKLSFVLISLVKFGVKAITTIMTMLVTSSSASPLIFFRSGQNFWELIGKCISPNWKNVFVKYSFGYLFCIPVNLLHLKVVQYDVSFPQIIAKLSPLPWYQKFKYQNIQKISLTPKPPLWYSEQWSPPPPCQTLSPPPPPICAWYKEYF